MKYVGPILLGLAVIVAWVLALAAGFVFFDSWAIRGQFGDYFGSVNSLFSGFAFAGLIYAILLQRRELSLQRVELKLQREEMAASRQQLAAQVQAQTALFRATVGQIRVAAEQARVEAEKVDSESKIPGARRPYVIRINEVADRMDQLADLLEETSTNS